MSDFVLNLILRKINNYSCLWRNTAVLKLLFFLTQIIFNNIHVSGTPKNANHTLSLSIIYKKLIKKTLFHKIEKDCSKLPLHKKMVLKSHIIYLVNFKRRIHWELSELVSNNFAFSFAMTDVQTIPIILFQLYFYFCCKMTLPWSPLKFV